MKPDPADRLTELYLSVDRAMKSLVNARLKKGGVSTGQHEALSHLAASGPMMMTTIAEKMGHTTAAATGLVDRLTVLGFVTRKQTPGDRRKVTVALTDTGTAFLAELRLVVRAKIESSIAGTAVRDLATFMTVAEAIASRAES